MTNLTSCPLEMQAQDATAGGDRRRVGVTSTTSKKIGGTVADQGVVRQDERRGMPESQCAKANGGRGEGEREDRGKREEKGAEREKERARGPNKLDCGIQSEGQKENKRKILREPPRLGASTKS